jgi:hypothetical protein
MGKKTLTEEDVLFVLGICRKSFEKNSDLANDCFLYVWEKLHEDDSRRIKAFKGMASFRTFIYSVTSKLIIDFKRMQFQHRALPKYYWSLDEMDRRIFKLFSSQNLASEWVEKTIQAEFKISEEEAQRRVDEVRGMMGSRVKSDRVDERQSVLLGEEVESVPSEERGINPEENIIAAEVGTKKREDTKGAERREPQAQSRGRPNSPTLL